MSDLERLRIGIPPSTSRARWNRWDQIGPAPAGLGLPRVDVVIPYYNQPEKLAVTLEALAQQTLAPDRFTVTIADDGSDREPVIPDRARRLAISIVRQDRDGPRRSRARNLGAQANDNPVVLFLDADMVPMPAVLERHARWHQRSHHAVTLSLRRHVPDGSEHDIRFLDAVRSRTLQKNAAVRRAPYPAFVEGHLIRTDFLRSGADDLFYAVSAGCLGVARSLFESAGGFDETFRAWGGEDLELGFRLFTRGADVIPLPDALCLHLGRGTSEGSGATIDQRSVLAEWIPHPSLRDVTARRGAIPHVVVTLVSDGASRAAIDFTMQRLKDDPFRDFDLASEATAASIDQSPMRIQLLASAAMPEAPISRLFTALRSAHGDAALAHLGPNGAFGSAVLRRAIHRSEGTAALGARWGEITVDTAGEPPVLVSSMPDTPRRDRGKELFGRLPPPLVRPATAAASAALAAVRRRRRNEMSD